MMPGMSGFEAATRIKAVHPECVVVIFSALPDIEDEALAQRDVDHFIPKVDVLKLDALLNEMRAQRA
jgi:CheY-like chemotaxis protein